MCGHVGSLDKIRTPGRRAAWCPFVWAHPGYASGSTEPAYEEDGMDSGMIGKILKAKQYAEERERIVFNRFSVLFYGDHNEHEVTYKDGHWDCSCDFFASHGVCSHTMALERILEGMLQQRAENADPDSSSR